MVFANIEYLFLLLLLIPYIVWYILKQKKSEATLQISDARVYAHTPKSYKNYLLHVPFLLRCIALVLVILVLAILGTLFGQRLLRKHFQKAGIVG